MDPDAWAAKSRYLADAADLQWQTLYDALVTHGANVEIIPVMPDLPDLVFTANAAVILDRKALLARFRHRERRPQGALDLVAELPVNLVLEGAGECIWDKERSLFWLGYGPRSDLASRHVVSDVFGVDCVPLVLADPRFYHLDTAFCPLPKGEVIY